MLYCTQCLLEGKMQEITPIMSSMFFSTDDDVMSVIIHRIFIRYTSCVYFKAQSFEIYKL